jgi:hypothetical protein
MTYEELVAKVAEAFDTQSYHLMPYDEIYPSMARVALAVVYEAMIDPNNKMINAASKAMSPAKRPTPEWVSAREKHAYRFMAMIEASPLKDRTSNEQSQSQTEEDGWTPQT